MVNFSKAVLKWFDAHGRKHLPWQQNPTAYRVWVSEIMLQQTQVTAVIPYYQRFMLRFPTVNALANASLDEVLGLWAGLGYYARARNLHKTAQIITQNYSGEFPHSVDEIQNLPGIGRSTAGNIVSLAFGQCAPILDGNVKRVLARFFALEGWPGTPANLQQLWEWSEQLTPAKRTGEYNQAMMDIGATVCTRTQPQCDRCPVQKGCRAAIQNLQQMIPQPKPQKEKPIRAQRLCLIINPHANTLLLQQRPPKGIWGGLWVYPEWLQNVTLSKWLQDAYQLNLIDQHPLPQFRHTFTHFHLDIEPVAAFVKSRSQQQVDVVDHAWYKMESLNHVGLPAPIKKIYESYRFLQKVE
jgi:A/G-specific adenine glycosylase